MKRILSSLVLLALCNVAFAVPSDALPDALILPRDKRPAWVREQGIVMAGSWEPLYFRVRRDDPYNVEHRITPEQIAAYRKEHSVETLQKLKEFGVNFVMAQCYKAFGIEIEKESMKEAATFADLCHKEGFRVGVYTYSGTLGWETFRDEVPGSIDWEILDSDGMPIPYTWQATYRHFFNRNNPDAQEYMKRIIKFAVSDVKADLIHLDNYEHGPGFDRTSMRLFREYLKRFWTPSEIGVEDLDHAWPPGEPPPHNALGRAWMDYSCQALAASFHDMSKYAKSLRPDILMECNPGNFRERMVSPTDHSRLLRYGEACWDEGRAPSYAQGRLVTRLVTYKTAQTMDNMVFVYIRTPLQAAESLAYNTDCLGCICQYEDGNVVGPGAGPTARPVSPDVMPYVRFFHEQRPYYRDADRVWDVGVLRSFVSQISAPDSNWQATHKMEDSCIAARIPWTLVFDYNLSDLSKLRAVSLVGAVALSNEQINDIRKYAGNGGGLILDDETGTCDEKMKKRSQSPFADLTGERMTRLKRSASPDETIEAMKRAVGGSFSLTVDAPPYLLSELTEQKSLKRRLVHLVNYNSDSAVHDAKVELQVPEDYKVEQVVLIRPESPERQPIEFSQDKGRVKFTVPQISVYGLLSVETNASAVK